MTALLLVSWLLTAGAQDAGVATPLALEQHVLPNSVALGEPFTYELSITHAQDARYELVAPGALGAFELLGQTRERKDAGGTAVTTFRLKLSGFELGAQTLPQLDFQVTLPAGVQHLKPKPPQVTVRSTLPPASGPDDRPGLKDLRPPTEVAVRSFRLVYAALGLIALGAALYALITYLRRRQSRLPPPAPPLPLHTRTLQALDALAAEQLPQQQRTQEFFFRLSELVRRYLGERYAFEALECTSSELLESLRRLSLPEAAAQGLRDFIHESDFVKYAKAEATEETCGRALAFAYQLVQATTSAAPLSPSPSTANAPGLHVP